uniref:uroporphyrinogen decarboxylase family protein n=1 Tax=uncultured Draconibacterium sp. TaxID=1573823 RepID=UPI0032166213
MNSFERMHKAMSLETPDRVPLMCQPSWGLVLKLNPDISPVDLWYNHNKSYPTAFCNISNRFHFDGVLIPGVGLAPLKRENVANNYKDSKGDEIIDFKNGDSCTYCSDDLPRYKYKIAPEVDIDEFNPNLISERLEYHPPSNWLKMHLQDTPEGRIAEVRQAREIMGKESSVHGAVYSPEDYLIDLLGVQEAMMAMITHPEKCKDILLRYAKAISRHLQEQIDAGVDAVNFSAPWTGQNFISLEMYEEIIAPAQKMVVDVCKANNVFSYCHTCGAIDDRLELIIDIGFDGLECLDPPPLGNVKLEDAVRRIGDRAFIKGNIDPVNVLLNGTVEQVKEDLRQRLEIGMKARGFILSSACALAPGTPLENLDALYEIIEKYGYY